MYALLLTLAAVLPPPMPDLPPVIKLDPTPIPAPAFCVVCKGTKMIKQGNGQDVPCPECVVQLAMAIGCQCESGGPCTCGDDCDCSDCQCEDCPGKTTKTVELTVCDASGCRKVRTTATRKDGLWYASHGSQWHIWKGGKWQKIQAAPDGSYRIERPIIKPMLWQAQPLSRAPGQHSHRCGMCGHTWSHYPGQSHRCPSCRGLSSQNYVQINSGRSYQRPVMRQPRRLFASRGG